MVVKDLDEASLDLLSMKKKKKEKKDESSS